jgi:hypothetical protein
MSSVSLTGADSIQISSRILADFADGDIANLTFPNTLASVKSSKNGNLIYAFNETGKQCELVIRVLAGSADDKVLNSTLALQKQDFSKFTLMTGVFTKRVGDGTGKITNVTYNCSGGVISKQPEQKTNVEGDTSQSVVVYNITFGNSGRVIA